MKYEINFVTGKYEFPAANYDLMILYSHPLPPLPLYEVPTITREYTALVTDHNSSFKKEDSFK